MVNPKNIMVNPKKTSAVKAVKEAAGKSDSTSEQAETPAPKPAPISPQLRQELIAKAAYFNAEKRGFTPGYEMQDWLEAEQKIAASLV